VDTGTADGSAKELKHCCARLYESDVAKVLLGDSFRAGGV
jgi:hypothetical protein